MKYRSNNPPFLTFLFTLILFSTAGIPTAYGRLTSAISPIYDGSPVFEQAPGKEPAMDYPDLDSVPGYKYAIHGVVYADRNANGIQDEGEPGMAGITVSDGLDLVETDPSGAYRLPNTEKNAAFVYVHQPGHIKQTGQHFFHILYTGGEKDRFNFGLRPGEAGPIDGETAGKQAGKLATPQKVKKMRDKTAPESGKKTEPSTAKQAPDKLTRFIQITDSHIRNISDRAHMEEATSELYAMNPLPDFVVATGDLVDWGVDEHYKNYVAGMQDPPFPYYNVFGNHELVFGPVERYHKYIGPDYFSFEMNGIVFLALNCVTKSDRQNRWVRNVVDKLVKDRPLVVFQHFPPELEELERFKGIGVKSVFSGHWHSEKEMEYRGVQSFNSPPFIMGGIDASPAGFKVVEMKADGTAETGWRYGFQHNVLKIVSPQPGQPVDEDFSLIVNAYQTSHDIVSVNWRIGPADAAAASGSLQQVSAMSWSSGVAASQGNTTGIRIPRGDQVLFVTAKDRAGNTWEIQQEINVVRSARAAQPSPSGDWPMFMGGAAHLGHTKSSLRQFPLRLAWAADTGGDPDFSSPILADGRIYLAVKKRTKGRANGVAAFDPVTGRQLWFFETEMAVNHTPAYFGGVLCIAEMGGRVYGIDAATGKERWHHDLIDNRGRYNYGAPAVYKGNFYVGVMRRMASIRAADGYIEWERPIGKNTHDWISSYGSPAAGDDLLAMSGMFFAGEALTVSSSVDGSRVWGHKADNGLLSSPTIVGDKVLYTSMKSVLYARGLRDGKELWQRELGGAIGDGKWSATTPAVGSIKNNAKIVVAGSGDGQMSGIDLATGEVLWTHVSGDAIFKVSPYRRDSRPLLSSPMIAGDKVFFGSGDGHVYGLDLQTGRQLWSVDLGVPVLSTPLVSGNTLYVAAYDGRLYAFTTGKK